MLYVLVYWHAQIIIWKISCFVWYILLKIFSTVQNRCKTYFWCRGKIPTVWCATISPEIKTLIWKMWKRCSDLSLCLYELLYHRLNAYHVIIILLSSGLVTSKDAQWCELLSVASKNTISHMIYIFILMLCFQVAMHQSDVIMSAMASQITGVSIICSTVCSGAYERKYQSYASLTFARGIHRWPVEPLIKGQRPGECFQLITSSLISFQKSFH